MFQLKSSNIFKSQVSQVGAQVMKNLLINLLTNRLAWEIRSLKITIHLQALAYQKGILHLKIFSWKGCSPIAGKDLGSTIYRGLVRLG